MTDQRVPSFRTGAVLVLLLVGALAAVGFVQANSDLADERTALEMIHSDLERDSAELAAMLNRGHRTERWVMWILRNLESDLPEDSIMGGLIPLFYYSNYEQMRAGYMNLLNAGRLTVISDPGLRQSVVDYFEYANPFMWQFFEMYMKVYQEFKETTAPYIRSLPDGDGDVFVQNFRVEFTRPWDEMKTDPHFIYKMTELGAVGSQWAVRIGPVLERNAELRTAIEEELGME